MDSALLAAGMSLANDDSSGASAGETVSGDIPLSHLLFAFSVILLEALAARLLEFEIAGELVISGTRAFLQLSLLGFVLHPIFAASNPCIVMGYIFGFMAMVSAYEVAARPKYIYPNMLWSALVSVIVSLLGSGILLLLIVAPEPWYNAQYLIPLAGMLMNNSLSGMALALNQMIDHFTSNQEYVEVLLAFGASPWEAAWPGFVKSAKAALIPTINGMNVIGIVSIPGMMTGQILGGASPMKAAKYQIVITFLISGCTFTALSLICALTIRALFDERGRYDGARLQKQNRQNIAKCLDPKRLWQSKPATATTSGGAGTAATAPLLDGASPKAIADGPLRLVGRAVEGGVALQLKLQGRVAGSRLLTADLVLPQGRVTAVMGPSGIGKSTLLKLVCDLNPAEESSMAFSGKACAEMLATSWRRDVLYIHQSQAPLPGTPMDLVEAVNRLSVNRSFGKLDPTMFMQKLDIQGLLERPWNQMSGGQAQRMMLAVALASRPAVVLLDEPTSALDEACKVLVESVVLEALKSGQLLAALLVTHDPRQVERLNAVVYQIEASSCA